jgi:hypothetical protein
MGRSLGKANLRSLYDEHRKHLNSLAISEAGYKRKKKGCHTRREEKRRNNFGRLIEEVQAGKAGAPEAELPQIQPKSGAFFE